MKPSDCSTNLNHGVTLVGYVTSKTSENQQPVLDYFIVKNSWGTGWGQSGYIWLQKGIAGGSGTCGIYMDPSFPNA